MNTNRLRLVACDEKLLEVILLGDAQLSKELGIIIPPQWSEFGMVIFEYTLTQIRENPHHIGWYAYLPIETMTNTLLGTCGYKGGPDENGMVEIGYEVAKDFRNQGYASEITKMLISHAFSDERVQHIQAHTLAEKNASVRVLEKNGFRFIEEKEDEEDGKIWKWMLNKS